jgi:hypothetical protein
MTARRKHAKKKSLGRRLLYLVSHLLCAGFAIVLFLTLVQCTIKKPEAPSWKTNLVIPLTNKTWDMEELIEKLNQENLTTDSSGNPLFFYENVLDTVTIDASFAVDDVAETFAESLGIVGLDPIEETGFEINLGGEFPDLPPGSFPDTSFDISNSLPALGDFAVATVSSGNMVVTVINDFGIDLDTVVVTINDDSLSGQITQYSIPGGIPDGETSVDTVDLAGKTISNKLSALIHCHTPGAPTFLMTADKMLSAGVGIPAGLNVSSATAVIPRISKSFGDTVEIVSDHEVTRAELENGQLAIDIQNNTALPDTLSITIPGLRNGPDSLVIDAAIDPNSSIQISRDLDGYHLEPNGNQELVFAVDAIVNSSGSFVAVNSTDDMSIDVNVSNITLASVEGTIASTSADFDDIEEEIDIPTGFDAMQLPSAMLILEITNSVNIPGSYSINIVHNNGTVKEVTGNVDPGTPENPVATTNEIALGDFMDPIPESITVNGSATFGGAGSVTPNDYVIAKITISSPLEMIINPNDSIEGDWEGINMDIDSSIVDGFETAHFYATFTNRLPVGVTAEILLGGDSTSLYSDPEVTLGPISVAAGYIDPATGTVDSARASTNEIIMDADMIKMLYNDTLWVGEWIKLDSTGGASVKMTHSDSLTITGYIEVEYNFSEDLFED